LRWFERKQSESEYGDDDYDRRDDGGWF